MDDYLQNTFQLKRITAGNIVLSFALMNIFARTLGGFFGDKFGKLYGLRGRILFLALILCLEGIMLSIFSQTTVLSLGIMFLVALWLTVQMAEGATFSVVPFINKKGVGAISGIVGAGGNVGAFLAAIFLKSKSAIAEKAAIAANKGLEQETVETARSVAAASAVSDGYLVIGIIIVVISMVVMTIRISPAAKQATFHKIKKRLAFVFSNK
jgi:NNP family nitrate/nitrite transporter-like MFS transporter